MTTTPASAIDSRNATDLSYHVHFSDVTELPSRVGQRIYFEAHGERFTVVKHKRNDFSLSYVKPFPRNRGGSAAEILSDIAHVKEFGTLPKPVGHHW